jgi:hypothetical protein
MNISGYDKEAVKAYLKEAFAGAPRGVQAAIAHEAGITESSVSRYRRGTDCPTPRYWPIIERNLGLPSGAIAKAGGLPAAPVARAAALEELQRTQEQMAQLAARVEALSRQLRKR